MCVMEITMNVAAEKIDRAFLKHREQFHRHIEEKLGDVPLDYAEEFQAIKKTWKEQEKHLAAGVFLLLQYGNPSSSTTENGPSFLLIKRSSAVAQSGDISCPGGILNPFVDSLASIIGMIQSFSPFKGESLNYARQRELRTFRTILLFLANAARESWEEIGLSPFNVSFLGALPTYKLRFLKRTIFPIVGLIKHRRNYKPNSEVEKIIEIPVKAFFDPDNYGRFYIKSENPWQKRDGFSPYFPCLILKQKDGTEEILWGATFNIITNFLSIVFEHSLPMFNDNARKISKTCPDNYLKGNSR